MAVHGESALVAITATPDTANAAGTLISMQPMSPDPSVSVRRSLITQFSLFAALVHLALLTSVKALLEDESETNR